MQSPTQITFRNIKPSAIIEDLVRAEADKLDNFYTRVSSCRVAIELPHRHHRRGNQCRIRVALTVPGEEIVVTREPNLSHRAGHSGDDNAEISLEAKIPHRELRTAINDAFKALGRRLQNYARRQRGDVKRHSTVKQPGPEREVRVASS